MPWHIQPVIRALEEVNESHGIQKTLDSAGVSRIKTDETAGASQKRVKQVPKVKIVYLGQTHTPS